MQEQKQLMILEVSQKQNYIFASRKLKDNIQRSVNIADVTGDKFFKETCPEEYSRDRNMIYSGGGHTVLQFDSADIADRFARAVTTRVLDEYPGMELFVKRMEYDPARTAGENLNDLSKALEIKKSRRQNSFRTFALGVEKARPAPETDSIGDIFKVPAGWRTTQMLEDMDRDDSFLAVIHVDGNAMGERVQNIYKNSGDNWDACKEKLDEFSKQITCHFEDAFNEMAEDLANALIKQDEDRKENQKKWKRRQLPLRKVIGAGDDVCFITTGKLGMECASNFLKHLSEKKNEADGQYYTACAGVVLIHKKYPFRQAYDLSEALCRSAKTFVSQYGGKICALDFHVEYGQIKSSLAEIREDYLTDDGCKLEIRPYAVTNIQAVPDDRTYPSLTKKLCMLEDLIKKGVVARSKLKQLRGPFREGEWETKLDMRMRDTERLLASDGTDSSFFTDDANVRRNRYFDAIELLDVTTLWQEVSK